MDTPPVIEKFSDLSEELKEYAVTRHLAQLTTHAVALGTLRERGRYERNRRDSNEEELAKMQARVGNASKAVEFWGQALHDLIIKDEVKLA